MHQSGHSRAQSMQEVQFSSVSAMTPRDRGGSAGETSGYSAVCVCRVSDLAVVARPLTSPGSMPSATPPHLPLHRRKAKVCAHRTVERPKFVGSARSRGQYGRDGSWPLDGPGAAKFGHSTVMG